MSGNESLPLSGIKIVELGTNLAVPTATRVLADWGADVIKVEGIEGDPWRNIGIQNYHCPVTPEENPIFMVPNANKRFVAMNLKNEGGAKAMLAILKDADVFISNVRYKGLGRLGIGYEDLIKINPNIIYAHFSGYGPNGEEAPRPGYDLTAFWARGGALIDWTDIGGYPMKPSGGFGDFVTGMSIASGILAAIIGRNATGKGTRIDTSLYSASIWYNSVNVVSTQERYGNKFPKSKMNPHNPFAGMFQGSDGEWVIININQYDQYYDQVCGILGMDDLIGDETFCKVTNLKENESLMREFIGRMFDAFSKKTATEWFDLFFKNDIPCEKLTHHADVAIDPQAWANHYLRKVDFQSGASVAMPCTPVQFSGYDTSRYDSYSRVGQHTGEVLEEAGLSREEIENLANGKVLVI